MAAEARELDVSLRPHAKSHKMLELVQAQLAAGAIGVSTATVWEALALARCGVTNILIANQVVGKEKLAALAEAAALGKIAVAVDDERNLEAIGRTAAQAGVLVDFVIEIDIGMRRGGVRSPEEAVALAAQSSRYRELTFVGVTGYEGHLVVEPERRVRALQAKRAMRLLDGAVDALERAGLDCPIVSAGGTGTYALTKASRRVTELQVGSYAVMDTFHEALVPDRFAHALGVACTVTSRHGRTIVLDGGRKAVGSELSPPQIRGHDAEPRLFAEEHGIFDFDGEPTADVGDRVIVTPGYAPTTVNLHEVVYVLEREIVSEVWPVLARAPFPLACQSA